MNMRGLVISRATCLYLTLHFYYLFAPTGATSKDPVLGPLFFIENSSRKAEHISQEV